MTHFDPDLIAALAEGSLDPDRAADLERAVAADPVAAAELAAQRAALEAVREAAPITLSDAERARLRAGIADQLGIVREPSPRSVPVRRRRIHWPAIAVAAASLVAVVAVVPGVLRTAGDDADRAGTMVLAEEAPTNQGGDGAFESDAATTAPDLEAAPLGASDQVVAEDGSEEGGVATTAAPTTTSAATTTTPAAATTIARFVDPAVLDLIESGALVADESVTACEAAAREFLGEEAAAVLVTFGDTDAVAWFIAGPEDLESLAVFDAADCSLLASLP